MTSPPITLGAINLEARDPVALAAFWAEVLRTTATPGGDSVYLPPAAPGGFGMFFQPAAGPRHERQVMHLDLTVAWGSRTTEVARLEALGASVRWHVVDEFPHVQWTTLADPEGNLFCVAEHPPRDDRAS